MNTYPQDLPFEWVDLFQHFWTPGYGLDAVGIRILMKRHGVTRESIAARAGCSPHYVDHVITRVRRSAIVELSLAESLSGTGLTREHLWGNPPPRDPTSRMSLPSCLAPLSRFGGRLLMNRHVVGLIVDCETTGFSPAKHGLIELGMLSIVCSHDGNGIQFLGIRSAYEGIQDPGNVVVDAVAMRINGIDLDGARGQRLDLSQIRSLREKATFVIAHNASFDRPFISREIPELGALPWFCSQKGIPWSRLGYSGSSLKAICQEMALEPPTHRALDDCRATIQALTHPLDTAGSTGLSTLLKGLEQRPFVQPVHRTQR
jgi:DNA polymerase III epsilon subunit-like protein